MKRDKLKSQCESLGIECVRENEMGGTDDRISSIMKILPKLTPFARISTFLWEI